MLIYKDFVSGDELCSDSYPMKEVDDVVYEFDGKLINVSNGIDASLIGGNPSQDEGGVGDEGVEDGSCSVVNIVHSHQLVQTNFTKKDYQQYLKGYLKKIAERLEKEKPERLALFKTKIAEFVKTRLMAKFEDWNFYTGETMDPDGMVVLMNYRDDGITPFFVLFKDGLIEEKC